EDLLKRLENGESVGEAEEAEMVEKLCRMMVGRDDRILRLAHTFFTLKDLLRIRTHLIGTGFLGGKTVGMLLARAILRKSRDVNWRQWMEPHDSFFVGSDVYYTYLVENGCWKLRLEQKQEENYFSTAATLREEMLNGRLPDTISEQIQEMLEYFGQAPIIVRSSSLLEDGFGNAFAGKYESIFCVNQGSPQERYNLFEKAVKTVYASTMNEDALAYRMQRGLAQNDEQMALLVQRVSGSHRGFYFFPDIAGVALSRNPYAWREDIDIGAGMMRLVLGLGTRAVDRVDDDYPRIIALDKPLLRPDNTQEEIQRFSQHKVDLLDTVQNELDTVPLINVADILKTTPRLWEYFAVRDHAATRKLREMGYVSSEAWTLTFEKLLVNTPFAKLMKNMLQDLEEAYRYPVDIEFTANLSSDAKLQINLLQCRPLQTVKNSLSQGSIEQVEPDKVFFSARNSFMGPDCSITATRLVYVRHDQYVELPLNEKYQIARLIGKINRQLKTQRQSVIFIGPGRWGTSTPSLGVPVSFAEICNAQVLVEVASPNNGVMPELSFGTHFFQDLVETGIIYVALFPDREGTVFNDKLIDQFPNRLSDLLPDEERWQEVITLIETDQKKKLVVDIDLQSRVTKCYFHDAK
ncbi:MAG: PEP/pyruvate-binding domain-containing protein, partial [Chitinophagales bacterium]